MYLLNVTLGNIHRCLRGTYKGSRAPRDAGALLVPS